MNLCRDCAWNEDAARRLQPGSNFTADPCVQRGSLHSRKLGKASGRRRPQVSSTERPNGEEPRHETSATDLAQQSLTRHSRQVSNASRALRRVALLTMALRDTFVPDGTMTTVSDKDRRSHSAEF